MAEVAPKPEPIYRHDTPEVTHRDSSTACWTLKKGGESDRPLRSPKRRVWST